MKKMIRAGRSLGKSRPVPKSELLEAWREELRKDLEKKVKVETTVHPEDLSLEEIKNLLKKGEKRLESLIKKAQEGTKKWPPKPIRRRK